MSCHQASAIYTNTVLMLISFNLKGISYELQPFTQVSWLVEFSILFSMFCLHFVLGDDNRAEQNTAAAIFGFLFPSINLLVFPLVQGCQAFSRLSKYMRAPKSPLISYPCV